MSEKSHDVQDVSKLQFEMREARNKSIVENQEKAFAKVEHLLGKEIAAACKNNIEDVLRATEYQSILNKEDVTLAALLLIEKKVMRSLLTSEEKSGRKRQVVLRELHILNTEDALDEKGIRTFISDVVESAVKDTAYIAENKNEDNNETFVAPDGREFFVGQRVTYETRNGDKKEYTIKKLNEHGNIELHGFPSYVSEKRLPFLHPVEEMLRIEHKPTVELEANTEEETEPVQDTLRVGKWISFQDADGKRGRYRIKQLDENGDVEFFEIEGFPEVLGKDRITLLKKILKKKDVAIPASKRLEDLRESSVALREKIAAYKQKYPEVAAFRKGEKSAEKNDSVVPIGTSSAEVVTPQNVATLTAIDRDRSEAALKGHREWLNLRAAGVARESGLTMISPQEGGGGSATEVDEVVSDPTVLEDDVDNTFFEKGRGDTNTDVILKRPVRQEEKKPGWLKRNMKKIAGTLAVLVGAGVLFRGEEVSSAKHSAEPARAMKEYKPQPTDDVQSAQFGLKAPEWATISEIAESVPPIVSPEESTVVEKKVETLATTTLKKGEGVLHGLDRIQKMKIDTSNMDSVQEAQWKEFAKKSAAEKRAWNMAQLEEMGFEWVDGKLAYPFTVHPGAEITLYQDPHGQFHARLVENNKVVLHDYLFVKEDGKSVPEKTATAMKHSEEDLYGFVEEVAHDNDAVVRRSFVYDDAVKKQFEKQGAEIQDLVDVDASSKQYIRMRFKNGAVVDVVPEREGGVWRLRPETASPFASAPAARVAKDSGSGKQRVFTSRERTVTPFLPETQPAPVETTLPIKKEQVVEIKKEESAQKEYHPDVVQWKEHFDAIAMDKRGEAIKQGLLDKLQASVESREEKVVLTDDELALYLPIKENTGVTISRTAFRYRNENGEEFFYVHPDNSIFFTKADNGIAVAVDRKRRTVRTIVGAEVGSGGEIRMILSEDELSLSDE